MRKRVETYIDLEKCVKVFNEGRLEIMIIEGNAGSGKSSMIRQSINHVKSSGYCWIEGRISAICLFEKLREYQGLPIFIDDVDGLYRDKECVNILKCLCQTEKMKRIMWNSKAVKGPTEFLTESKICVITNSWKRLNKHIGAVEDRGLLVEFHPSALEVHNRVAMIPAIFDKNIHDFIGQFLGIIKEPSIRHYRNALQLIGSDLDWKEVLLESFGITPSESCVLELKSTIASENDKAKMFANMLSLSERTYWRIKAELTERGITF